MRIPTVLLAVLGLSILTACGNDVADSKPVSLDATQWALDAAGQDGGVSADVNLDGGAPCTPSQVTETCDGIDNDCDGETDETACDDGNPCTTDKCDPNASPTCSHNKTSGGPCDDGDPCTIDDACAAGGCVAGPSKDCDDDDPCTKGDTCKAGACVAGQSPDCDDQNPCTADTCDLTNGECKNEALADKSLCDDGKPCTGDDICVAGACVGSTSCEDNNPCTEGICDLAGGCTQTAATGAACDDGKACTKDDTCADGVCSGQLNCDDKNPCTSDACGLSGGCTQTALNGNSCEDGNPCTAKELCIKGACVPGAATCDDGDICTSDVCSSATGACSHGAATDGANCDDGLACTTTSSCKTGKCVGIAQCDDKQTCTVDTCDMTTGKCVHKPIVDGTDCDADNNGCTLSDTCKAGKCEAGTTVTCQLPNKPCNQILCASTGASTYKCETSQVDGCFAGMRTAVADAYVKSSPSGSNYGKATALLVDRSYAQVYLKFDLKDVPKTAKLKGAILHMTVYTGYAYGNDGNVYTTLVKSDAWSESTINWKNKPATSGGSLGHWWQWYNNNTAVVAKKVDTKAFTDVVAKEIAGDGVLSLRLHSPGYKTYYRSREYSNASQRPRLELFYTTK